MLDQNLIMDDAAALTSSRVSTNVIPLGPLADDNAERDISGIGANPLFLELHVGTAFTSTGSSTLVTVMQTDDTTAFGSAATILTTPAIAKAALTAGARFRYPLPPGPYEDYLRLSYTVGVADFTGGTITAAITDGLGRYVAPAAELSNA